jgi:hypothetical protein
VEGIEELSGLQMLADAQHFVVKYFVEEQQIQNGKLNKVENLLDLTVSYSPTYCYDLKTNWKHTALKMLLFRLVRVETVYINYTNITPAFTSPSC